MKLNLQMCSNKTLLVSVLDSVVLQKALLAEGDRLGFFYNFIYFDCSESSLLCRLFSSSGKRELLSSCGAQASHRSGFSCCK